MEKNVEEAGKKVATEEEDDKKGSSGDECYNQDTAKVFQNRKLSCLKIMVKIIGYLTLVCTFFN